MRRNGRIVPAFVAAVVALMLVAPLAESAEILPAEKAGTIGQPTGRIAFVRDKDIWVMNADGQNQDKICAAGNADGRPSWSPDGKLVMFTRSGKVVLKGPDNMGGKHKVYDLFIASLDSAYANKDYWWRRATNDLGSRDPDWVSPDKVVFYKDINANDANAVTPNYQICTIEPEGGGFKPLRKDWANPGEQFLIAPSMNANGDIVCEYFEKVQRVGLAVIPAGRYMMPLDSIAEMAKQNTGLVAPAWSPDGKWIAYINNRMDDGGLYIATPDLKQKYLVTKPPVGTYLKPIRPSFSPDSKWLTFSTQDGSIWIIDITGNGARRLTGPGMDSSPAWSKQ
ncbi:MAG: PD40 domain-containing protein [candidate division Zixibacteria bacterium]|nr:PD40 domain-containing protein [candidate division Zixibacteria bacterium]